MAGEAGALSAEGLEVTNLDPMNLIDQDEITVTSSWISYHRNGVFDPFVFNKNKTRRRLRPG